MINKFLIMLLMLCVTSCGLLFYDFGSRDELDKSIQLFHSDSDISIKIELREKRKLKPLYNDEYFYYGVMEHQLLSNRTPKEVWVSYKNEESEVYLDSIADVTGFWDRSRWNENGFRKNKVYVVFDDPDIDWRAVKIIEKESSKKMTHKNMLKSKKISSSKTF